MFDFFSGITIYDIFIIQGYNVLFAAGPIIIFAVLLMLIKFRSLIKNFKTMIFFGIIITCRKNNKKKLN